MIKTNGPLLLIVKEKARNAFPQTGGGQFIQDKFTHPSLYLYIKI